MTKLKPAQMTPAQRAAEIAHNLGRSQPQVAQLLSVGRDLIIERQEQTYSQWNRELAWRTGQPQIDLSDPRKPIGWVLGEISRLELPDIQRVTGKRALLTVLVWLQRDGTRNNDELGGGFFDLSEELVGLTGGHKASQAAKDRSFIEQHRVVIEYIKTINPPRPRVRPRPPGS